MSICIREGEKKDGRDGGRLQACKTICNKLQRRRRRRESAFSSFPLTLAGKRFSDLVEEGQVRQRQPLVLLLFCLGLCPLLHSLCSASQHGLYPRKVAVSSASSVLESPCESGRDFPSRTESRTAPELRLSHCRLPHRQRPSPYRLRARCTLSLLTLSYYPSKYGACDLT